MTNKQTIDGVSRELLERSLNAAEWQKIDFVRSESPFKEEIASTVQELRALLDKPEYPRVSIVKAHTHTCACVTGDSGVCDCGAVVDGVSVEVMPVDQHQGKIVNAKVSAYTPGMGLVEVRLSGGIPSWLELGESVTITPELPQPQGEVERLSAELSKSNVAHEAAAQHQGELNTRIFQLERTLAERDALLRDKFGGVRAMAERACGTPKDSREYRALVEAINPTMVLDLTTLSTSAEPKPRGEPVAWRFRVSDSNDWFVTTKKGVAELYRKTDDSGGSQPLYAEQPAPFAVEAAKAFAKGFNTLESVGGKYRINMQFQSREDAWGAFNVLAHLKQLNTPQ